MGTSVDIRTAPPVDDHPVSRRQMLAEPAAWVGLANIAVLSSALVAVLRQVFVEDWRGVADQLPDPRWSAVAAVLGLAVLALAPMCLGVAVSLAATVTGVWILLVGVAEPLEWMNYNTVGHNRPYPIGAQTWQEWVDVPLRAEGIAAAAFAGLALVGLVIVSAIRRTMSPLSRGDARWWAAAGAYAIMTTAIVALLRLWHTQDTMHRELGSAGFLSLLVVSGVALMAALLVRQHAHAWFAVIPLAVAAAMCGGPALAWAEQTKGWPGPALVHQSMVVEGFTGMVLGGVAAGVALFCLLRAPHSESVTSAT